MQQALKTITKTTTTKQKSVHADVLYAVIQNAHAQVSAEVMCADCTSDSYYIKSANIYAQLLTLYAHNYYDSDYYSLSSVMEIFANNITYYDESNLFNNCVHNTALTNVKLSDYAYLSN
jgi:hypothetical protein